MSNSVRPQRWQPTRLFCPWDSPGKNTGVGAISFYNSWEWKVKVKLLSRVRLHDPMDCSPPGSSIHGIFQARILEWGAISFSMSPPQSLLGNPPPTSVPTPKPLQAKVILGKCYWWNGTWILKCKKVFLLSLPLDNTKSLRTKNFLLYKFVF